jgi:phage tail-like protein
MDVNGTKYHLVYGPDDWARCLVEQDGVLEPLASVWNTSTDRRLDQGLEWVEHDKVLRLARKAPLFRQSRRTAALPIAARRGAGRDQYGNWYWIDERERALRWLPRNARVPGLFWDPALDPVRCPPADVAAFRPCWPSGPPGRSLRGLAVTSHHYLVVGSPAEHGLLAFDLHGGGPPTLVRWPAHVPFSPWDIAARDDGGVLVLDRDNLTYWSLGADFRLLADIEPPRMADFQPAGDGPRRATPGRTFPRGHPLDAHSTPDELSPVSIEPGPDGNVLILDSRPDRPYSIVYEYRGDERLGGFSLEASVELVDPRTGDPAMFSVAGHDFAFVPGCPLAAPPDGGCQATGVEAKGGDGGRSNGIVYVAERDGNQVFAFEFERRGAEFDLEDRSDFLPLRRWGGRALVRAGNDVFYDFAQRWVPLRIFAECTFAGRALLVTPVDAAVAGSPFDSREPGCVWHRLLLDAAIPQGCAVAVRARAADDPGLLASTAWLRQPAPYLRGGAELPFFEPWPERKGDESPLGERTGTWELLFQEVRGRYIQIELEMLGTGRSTIELRALRAWYPRFSYSERYLPAIYREQPGPASFIERWLANFEGLYTNLEDKIDRSAVLIDPRTAPPEALEWLGCWLGLVLDPLLTEAQRRFLIRNADRLYRQRGTLPGVEIAVRLYLEEQPDDRLFDPRCLGGGKVRVVERFRTRSIGGLAFGDPSQGEQPMRPLTLDDAYAAAHRFTVLVPHDLDAEQFDMVDRIVRLEKPAHTAFALKRYWDFFRAGEARLGLDTRLGDSARFVAMLLGAGYLTESYLEPPYPFDIADRLVADRDRLGDMPPL